MNLVVLLQRKGSILRNVCVIGLVVLALPFVVSIVFNLFRASDAVRKFSRYSPAFQYFVNRDILFIDGKEWRVSTKDIGKMSRLIQYLPAGQSLGSSTESFLYLEVLAPPPITSQVALQYGLENKAASLKKDCPSGELNILTKGADFLTLDFLCQERGPDYSFNGIAFFDGVVTYLSYAQAPIRDLANTRMVWETRTRSLLHDGIWK